MRRARGFTLIEVLLATTLLALGLVLAFGTLRTAAGSVARGEDAAARHERVRAVQAFLRRQFSTALALPYARDEDSGEVTVFEGDADEVRFVAPMPGYLSRGGAYQQVLHLVPDDGDYRLEFEHRLLLGDEVIEPADELVPEVLLEGIAEAAFEFRALDQDGEPTDWSSDWPVPGQLPLLLRLRLRFADPRTHWPDLEIPLRVGATRGYVLGAVSPLPTTEGGAPRR